MPHFGEKSERGRWIRVVDRELNACLKDKHKQIRTVWKKHLRNSTNKNFELNHVADQPDNPNLQVQNMNAVSGRDFLYTRALEDSVSRVSSGQLVLIGLKTHHIAVEQCKRMMAKNQRATHTCTPGWETKKWDESFFGTKTTRLKSCYARDMPSISIQYRPNYFQISWQILNNCPWNILSCYCREQIYWRCAFKWGIFLSRKHSFQKVKNVSFFTLTTLQTPLKFFLSIKHDRCYAQVTICSF